MKSKSKRNPLFTCTAILVFLGVVISLFPGLVVLAQTIAPLAISSTDISQFPNITLDIRISKEVASSLSSLTADQIQVSEQGNTITPNTVNKIEPGLQTILALNAGTYMAVDYRLQTLYGHVQKQVLDWLSVQPSTEKDDFSFTSNTGTIISHVTDPQILSQSFAGFKPNLLAAIPSLQALSSALSIAAEPLARQTMQRSIFYITVLPDKKVLESLPSLIAQASSLDVKVFVWLIGPKDMAGTPNTLPLVQLAESTGGEFFFYSGPETFPDLNTEFSPLRSFYQVQYSSLIRKTGTYDVAVNIMGTKKEWSSPGHPLEIILLPPNVFFLSPKTSVHRIWEQDSSKESVLAPSTLTFQIKVEFPDGHPRALLETKFLVDGEIVESTAQSPFDTFTWDITAFMNTGEHSLQIKGEDILGFNFQTSEIPVDFAVDPKPLSFFARLVRFITSGPVLATLIGLVTIGAIVAIILRTNRNLAERKKQKIFSPNIIDPLTQQIDMRAESILREGGIPSQPLSHISTARPYARLVRLSEITQDAIPEAILYISKRDVTLGSDPRVVTIGIAAPSVSPIHARIQLTDSGTFIINDLKSTAGTWVNFAPVSAKGATLESGDLVHLGKLLYRFEVLNRPLV
jgi:hypothetical protein